MNKFKLIFSNIFKKEFDSDDFWTLQHACENGNIQLIEDLFKNKKIKEFHYFSEETIFNKVCSNEHLNIVKYLLNSNNTKNFFHDIYLRNYSWIVDTCENGHFSVIKYLFSSKNLARKVDIHIKDDQPFVSSSMGLNLELIKFFTSSPDLKEHANIHAQNDKAFLSVLDAYYNKYKFKNVRTYLKYSFMSDPHGNRKKI